MNPRAYPRGPRYRVGQRAKPVETRRGRRPRLVIAGAAGTLVLVGAVLAVVILTTSGDSTEMDEPDNSTAMNAARPRDFVPTATPFPTPIPTATPKPVPTADPSLTTEEVASIIAFANSIMFLEMRQRNLIREYRIYNIDFLTRWIGENYTGAEALLERQRRILNDIREIEAPDIEGAAEALSLYQKSMEEGEEAFQRLLIALGPLNEAGISVVAGIRTGMLPNIGTNALLSRSAMTRLDARGRLEVLVNRTGLVLGDVESTRSGGGEDF